MRNLPAPVTQADVEHVHLAGVVVGSRLTPQEERFFTLFCYGFPLAQAARHSGMTPQKARALVEDPRAEQLLNQIRETYADEVRITRETITVLLLEAHRKAASAGEEIAAAKELGKLHGLYKSDEQRGTKITQNNQFNGDVTVAGRKKLTRMTTDQLIELAQFSDPEDQEVPQS
jgi:hypothetical protein